MLGLRSTRGAAALVEGVPSAAESAAEGAVCHESEVRDVCEEKRGWGGAFGAFALAIAQEWRRQGGAGRWCRQSKVVEAIDAYGDGAGSCGPGG
jgi:hypothetical protein